MSPLGFRQFIAAVLVLVGAALFASSCGGGGDDDNASSSVVEERVSGGDDEAVDVETDDFVEPDLSIDLDTPPFDPETLEDLELDFLSEEEEACVANRVEEGASLELVSTFNGCVSAESVEGILATQGLELTTTEALCVFDARAEHEADALESETAVEAIDLQRALNRNTVDCMTQETVDERIVDVYPDVEFSDDEARCTLQVEFLEADDVFDQVAWCGVAGRVLATDGLDVSTDGVACIDQLSQAALPESPEELPELIADCVSEADLEVVTAEYG